MVRVSTLGRVRVRARVRARTRVRGRVRPVGGCTALLQEVGPVPMHGDRGVLCRGRDQDKDDGQVLSRCMVTGES